MFTAIATWWATSPHEVQGAIIGAFATVATAVIGAIVVIKQIGKQARLAIYQNTRHEASKLKLQIYEEFLKVASAATEAEANLSAYVRNFITSLTFAQDAVRHGYPIRIPDERAPELNRLHSEVGHHAAELAFFTERWQIVEPRLDLFQAAINSAAHDIFHAFHLYFEVAMRLMPTEIEGQTQPGATFPWSPPDDKAFADLVRLGNALLDCLMDFQCYIADFQTEMQPLLLSELFANAVQPRRPLNPEAVVVRLDDYDRLIHFFTEETPWGKTMQQTNAEVAAHFGVDYPTQNPK